MIDSYTEDYIKNVISDLYIYQIKPKWLPITPPKKPENPNKELFNNLDDLNELVLDYTGGDAKKSNQLVLQYVRRTVYKGGNWNVVAGEINQNFVKYVDKNDSDLDKYFSEKVYMIDPKTGEKIDLRICLQR